MGRSMSLTETMTLVSAKLSALVPFSTCALFVRRGDEDLRCRFATGLHADLLENASIAEGNGLSGWVARHRRPLVNGLPSVEFNAAGALAGRHPAAVCAGLPVDGRGRRDRHDRRLPSRPRIVHGRPSPRARSGGPSGGVSRPQCARVRAHPGTGIQRWPDRTRQPARAAVSGRARAGARPPDLRRSSRSCCWISTTSRSSTTSMGTSPAIARCRRSPGCCSRRPGRTIRASGTEATNSSSCFRRADAAEAEERRRRLQEAVAAISLHAEDGREISVARERRRQRLS